MLEKMSMYLANQLYIKGEIAEDKIVIIRYGFEIMISSLFILLSIPLCAIIMFRLSDGIIFLLFFMPVRLFSGGYHAPTYKCTFRINGAPFPRQRCKRLAPAVRYPFVVTC